MRSGAVLLLVILFCSCTARRETAGRKPAGYSVPAALAVLEAGKNPLWFELTESGPRQISFPDEAGLSPFVPWPLARHIRFTLALGNEVILAVNRDGFLRFSPWAAPEPAAEKSGGIALYHIPDAGQWGPYTLAALFPFEGRAAVLLYRDDFFADSSAPLPAPRSFSLDPDSPKPRPLEIPAFGDFSAAAGWDMDALHAGPGGNWYYRGIRKNTEQPERAYYRTQDLAFKGEAVSLSAFQNSALPEPLSAAPPLLRSVLEAALAQSSGGAATVVFPGLPGPRHFTGGTDSTGAVEGFEAAGMNAAGFYREPAAARPGIALAVLPGGRFFFRTEAALAEAAAVSPAASGGPRTLSLPPLPPGFAYTAAALCGDTLVVAWEEQEGYSIGAAGFMAIAFSY
jgi:hypothetical protein